MTRAEWRQSKRDLRTVLHNLKNTLDGTSIAEGLNMGKFAMYYEDRHKFWVLYNGVRQNVIATFRPYGGNIILRYRENSLYKEELFKFNPEKNVILVKSSHLGRYASNAREYLQRVVDRNLSRRGEVNRNQTATELYGIAIDPSFYDATLSEVVAPEEGFEDLFARVERNPF